MPEIVGLAHILANRAWLRRERPFAHVVARNVFEPTFYRALEEQLRHTLALRLGDTPKQDSISRNMPGYDAYGIGFNESIPEPMGIFVSPAWRDVMCNLFGVSPTPYLFAGVHYHAVGSEDGFIHNDFNPVWFPCSLDKELRCPDQTVCAYKTGAGSLKPSEKTEVVRAVAMIFFLLNDSWQPGEGGETGLFDSRDARLTEPVLRCPPENNSLLMFECTPYSFHAYLGKNRRPRRSIIMWVHRSRKDAIERYGEDRLERWRS